MEYKKFIMDGIGGKNPMTDVIGQNILGNNKFLCEVSEIASLPKDIEHLQRIQKNMEKPDLNGIISGSTSAKQTVLQVLNAHIKHGYSISKIADFLGIDRKNVTKVIKMTR